MPVPRADRARFSGWRRTGRWLGLLFSGDPADYYTYLGGDVVDGWDERGVVSSEPLWLNLGYWKAERTYPGACKALALYLAEAAGLRPGDALLDAGFGFAEQDLLWLEEYDLGSIDGVNVTPLHVRVGRERVEERGLADRIRLRQGSATELPFPKGTFDKAVALESAFHFDTRERFFAEALRTLRPGGRLATADMLPLPGEGFSGLGRRLMRRSAKIPEANMYDRFAYADKLRSMGFEDVRIESIREHVFPGMSLYAERRSRGESMEAITVDLTDDDVAGCWGVERWLGPAGIGDYVVATAVKPCA